MPAMKVKGLSARDVEFICEVITYLNDGLPKADWKAVAAATGLKNANVAQTKYWKVKKKMELATGQAAASTAKATPAKTTPIKTTPGKHPPEKVIKEETGHVVKASKRGTKRTAKRAFGFTPINKPADEDDDEYDGQEDPESEPAIPQGDGHEHNEESQGEEPIVKLEA